jgi:hypothetical protein
MDWLFYTMITTDTLQRVKIAFLFVVSISLGLALFVNLISPLSTESSTSIHIVGTGIAIADILCVVYFAWLSSTTLNMVYGFNISENGITFLTGIGGKIYFPLSEATEISRNGLFPHYGFSFGKKSLSASVPQKNIKQVISIIKEHNPNILCNV